MRLRLTLLASVLAFASVSVISAQSAANKPALVASELLRQVNSCDAVCLDQIGRAVRQPVVVSAKQSAPNVVEKSKQDQPWQALLVEAIAVQSQSCDSRAKKNHDANGNKELARRLTDVSSRANAHIKTVSDQYLAEFMKLQLNRVWNTNCPSSVAHIPSRHDPEDADAQKDESATNDPPDDNR